MFGLVSKDMRELLSQIKKRFIVLEGDIWLEKISGCQKRNCISTVYDHLTYQERTKERNHVDGTRGHRDESH
jgi:hypothetical protein